MAIERVRLRVREGGHNIPTETVKRRYKKGIKNLFKIFSSLCNRWIIIDNSNTSHIIVAEGSREIVEVFDEVIWQQIKIMANEKN